MTMRCLAVRRAAGAAFFLTIGAFCTEASAAMQAPCVPAQIEPAAVSIPVNFPGFSFTALDADANDVKLVATSATTDVPLTLSKVDGLVKVVPTSALTVGTSYTLTFSDFCGYGAFPVQNPITFTATAEAPLPTKVGTVSGAPTFTVKDFGTSAVTINATYTLEAEMKPWASTYRFGLYFDGKPLASKVTVAGDGTTVSVAGTGWCDAASAAKPKHDLELRARLPFAPKLQTSTTQLEFSCPAPKHTPPPNTPVTATTPRTTADGGTNNATPANSGGSSGGCAVGFALPPSPAVSAFVVIALLGLRARRRQVAKKAEGGK